MWNYRRIHFKDDDTNYEYYRIVETFYDENGKPNAYCDAQAQGDTEEELRSDYDMMKEAFDRPCITWTGVELIEEP